MPATALQERQQRIVKSVVSTSRHASPIVGIPHCAANPKFHAPPAKTTMNGQFESRFKNYDEREVNRSPGRWALPDGRRPARARPGGRKTRALVPLRVNQAGLPSLTSATDLAFARPRTSDRKTTVVGAGIDDFSEFVNRVVDHELRNVGIGVLSLGAAWSWGSGNSCDGGWFDCDAVRPGDVQCADVL